MRKLITAVALVASVAGLSIISSASPAFAGAYGCNAWTTKWAGYTVPSGAYCATISGQGRYVQAVSGSYGATNLCNTRITAEFFTDAWRWTRTYNSDTWGGCGRSRSQTIWIATYAPTTGFMCSTLYSNNVRMTSVCHQIKN